MRSLLLLPFLLASWASAGDFHVYAPSRTTETLQVVSASVEGDSLTLSAGEPVALGFTAATITAHPEKPLLYVTSNRGTEDGAPGALISLAEDGSVSGKEPFTVNHGYSFLSLDRANRFLLGCNYGDGHVDVYPLDENDLPGKSVASLDEGRKAAHCVLPSPDNRFIYIPYVKEHNALYQYAFDPETGALSPLDPLDAKPPENTGPRHLAYHPTLPMLYFSSEQQLGVSVWKKAESGHLTLHQLCDLTGPEAPAEGVSSSDIVITPDGRFLFAGIRGHRHEFDWISRYRVLDDGSVEHLGLTPADKIPWGLALSPCGDFLLATGFGEGSLMAYRVRENGDLTRVATLAWDEKISDVVTR